MHSLDKWCRRITAPKRAAAAATDESQLRVCHNCNSSSIRARFELDSIREPCHNCDSIRARFEHSRIFHSRIESQLWQGSRIDSSSNRARIVIVTDAYYAVATQRDNCVSHDSYNDPSYYQCIYTYIGIHQSSCIITIYRLYTIWLQHTAQRIVPHLYSSDKSVDQTIRSDFQNHSSMALI